MTTGPSLRLYMAELDQSHPLAPRRERPPRAPPNSRRPRQSTSAPRSRQRGSVLRHYSATPPRPGPQPHHCSRFPSPHSSTRVHAARALFRFCARADALHNAHLRASLSSGAASLPQAAASADPGNRPPRPCPSAPSGSRLPSSQSPPQRASLRRGQFRNRLHHFKRYRDLRGRHRAPERGRVPWWGGLVPADCVRIAAIGLPGATVQPPSRSASVVSARFT